MKQTKTELAALTLLLAGAAFLLGVFVGRGAAAEKVLHLPQAQIAAPAAEETPPDIGRLDLNTATAEELAELPGIGESLAERIVTYRQENGAFIDVEELRSVYGIGEKKLEAIRAYITIGS